MLVPMPWARGYKVIATAFADLGFDNSQQAPDDVPWLLEQGVACVFTPGTRIPDAALAAIG